MPDIQINQPRAAGDYDINNYLTHLIPPEKKDEKWAYNIFVENRRYMNVAFGGWYWNQDADLIKQFAYGNQPVSRYKIVFDPQDKESVYMGLNWDIAPVIPPLRQRVLAELNNIPTEVECEAVDEMANSQRNMDKLRLKAQSILDEKLKGWSQRMGYDRPMKSGFDKKILNSPMNEVDGMKDFQLNLENDDELNIYMDRDSGYYNQDIELANELAIQAIFKHTGFNDILIMCKDDTFDYGICAFRSYIDSYTGLPVFQYLNPSRLWIQKSKYKDYHDVNMWYYAVPSTLADLIDYFGNDISEQEARDIWDKSAKRRPTEWVNGYPSGYNWDWRRWSYGDLRKVEIDMFYFEVKTNDYITYEVSKTKTGGVKMKKKTLDYEPPKESQNEKRKQNYWAECWYGGYYVEGLTKVYKWGKIYNQERLENDPQKARSTLNIFKFSEKGLTEQAIAMADAYQLVFLKRQHLINHSLPPGYSFNWDALAEVDYGTGGKVTKDKLLQMYFQTGNTIHRSLDEAGDPILANANAPHMRLENGIDPQVIAVYTNTMLEMRQEIALTFGMSANEAAVSQNPSDLLVGIQNAAQQASINSRHYLYIGVKRIIERAGEYVSRQLQYIAKNNPSAWDRIKGFVGSVNTSVIETMDGFPLHSFAIYAKNAPTQQEIAEFKQMVYAAWSKVPAEIDLADILTIFSLTNLKLAKKLFVLKRNRQLAMNQQMAQQQMQMQAQMMQQQEQMKLMLQKMDNDGKMGVAQIQGQMNNMQQKQKEDGDNYRKILAELSKHGIQQKEFMNQQQFGTV